MKRWLIPIAIVIVCIIYSIVVSRVDEPVVPDKPSFTAVTQTLEY